nr:NeseNPVORF52-like protein [Oryctes rhinoceros nudivirus]
MITWIKKRHLHKKLYRLVENMLEKLEEHSSESPKYCDTLKVKSKTDFRLSFMIVRFINKLCKLICPERVIFYKLHLRYNSRLNKFHNDLNANSLYRFSHLCVIEFITSWCLLHDLVLYFKYNCSSLTRSPAILWILICAVDHMQQYRLPQLDGESTIEDSLCNCFAWDEFIKDKFVNEFRITRSTSSRITFKKTNTNLKFYNSVTLDDLSIQTIINRLDMS